VTVLDDLRDAFLTAGLTDQQRSDLCAAGKETFFKRGDELFREGEPADLLWVEIERDFAADVPAFDAYAAELNQVWTNLIDNAIDAMDGHGTLRLSTRLDGSDVVIDITDSGHGMPADVEARVFEPFFTTKDVGKGTGLGLDISRRIVAERHHGEITFDSVPGRTTVRVRIPISR